MLLHYGSLVLVIVTSDDLLDEELRLNCDFLGRFDIFLALFDPLKVGRELLLDLIDLVVLELFLSHLSCGGCHTGLGRVYGRLMLLVVIVKCPGLVGSGRALLSLGLVELYRSSH